jgi:predicted nucleic acid-binding protein
MVLDACVLVPAGLRGILLRVAAAGLFRPLWSHRILEEWARAARRHGPAAEAEARIAVALAIAAHPAALVPPAPGIEARLHLPDANDIHVLATAIAGQAEAIVTFNAADFPRGALAAEGIARRDPDGLLWDLWSQAPGPVAAAVAAERAEAERATAERATGQPRPLRAWLRRAGLPRLARALAPPPDR